MKPIVSELFEELIREAFALIKKSNDVLDAGRAVDRMAPMIVLMVQEMELQRIRKSDKRDVTPEDASMVATSMQVLQANPLSFGLMYLSVQFGYLLARFPQELDGLIRHATRAIDERNKQRRMM